MTTRFTDTRTGETRSARTSTPPRSLSPTVALGDDGRLRFVHPLVCATVTTTDVATFEVVRVKPNPATLIVGIIATALGAVGMARGIGASDPAGSPLTYAGAGGVALGLPLVIGPLVGNHVERNPQGNQAVPRPGPDQPCGEAPVTGRRAVVLLHGMHVEGPVDDRGVFALSPFDFVDAFDPKLPALDLAVDVIADARPTRIDRILDASALAAARPGFFAARGLDATVPEVNQLDKLARYDLGPLAVTLVPGPSLRVALPITNVGPGRGYGLRATLASSSLELDGRVIYLGSLAAGAGARFETTIPLSAEAARAVDAAGFELAVLVRDGHDLAPSSPVRLRGMVLRSSP